MEKEKFVRDIVQGILDKDGLDTNRVIDIQLDDHGNCLHVKFTGGVSVSTITAIGKAFGESDPNVYGEAGGAIYLVMVNDKYEELKD